MNEIGKNIVDCGLAVMISFISAALALDEVTFKCVFISFLSGLLIGLLKFRDYYQTQLNPKTPVQQIFI
jgi:hypothetical protein